MISSLLMIINPLHFPSPPSQELISPMFLFTFANLRVQS